MLSTSPQSPVGLTRHHQTQWQDSSGLTRTRCKEQILLACKVGDSHCACFLGKQHRKWRQPSNILTPPPTYNLGYAMAKTTVSPINL